MERLREPSRSVVAPRRTRGCLLQPPGQNSASTVPLETLRKVIRSQEGLLNRIEAFEERRRQYEAHHEKVMDELMAQNMELKRELNDTRERLSAAEHKIELAIEGQGLTLQTLEAIF